MHSRGVEIAMKLTTNPSKTEIHITEIDNKHLYATLLEEINATEAFCKESTE
jgi:hypothetical protein